jgi:hypothetical protein
MRTVLAAQRYIESGTTDALDAVLKELGGG